MELFAQLFAEMLSSAAGSDDPGRAIVNALLATLAVIGLIILLAAMAAAGS